MESAIQELLKGRDFTCQLKLLLTVASNQSFLAREGGCAEDLVGKILSTFTHTISLLSTTAATTTANVDSSDDASGPRKSESSSADNSSKASYRKKRKTAPSQQSWIKESPTLVDDGYAWRKYGQKTILKSEFSRHYYRCTHKLEYKCPATKQVQMIQDKPNSIYRTTYSAHHTCNNHFRTLHPSSYDQNFQVDPVDDSGSSHLISFNNINNNITPFLTSFSAPSAPVAKQQHESLGDVAMCHPQTGNLPAAASSGGEDDYDMLSSLVDIDFDQEFFNWVGTS
ncbi:unnamed protein product [Linum tenue]|uniref:WRKY domain-containing protein n=1 Tax=Linum tenue TaxID=586396 RepID=A0AAV0KSD0_9ROSI|nr:unnamed protein product [Linum tenue]CAI0423752.1 unnamed protein product [Linum tenue]